MFVTYITKVSLKIRFQNFKWDILQMRLTFHSHYGTWKCHWPLNFRIFLSTEYRKSLAVQEVLYTLLQARLWAVIFTSITCTISVTDWLSCASKLTVYMLDSKSQSIFNIIRWVAGSIVLLTKRLMVQVLFW